MILYRFLCDTIEPHADFCKLQATSDGVLWDTLFTLSRGVMVESKVNSSFFINQQQERCGFIPVWREGTSDQIVVVYLPMPGIGSASFD